jgi:hypothetical protein
MRLSPKFAGLGGDRYGSRPQTRTKRSVLAAIAIITAAIVGMIGLAASPASASQTCTGQLPRSNVCLGIWQLSDGNYAVHVGIDDVMSLSDCHSIIDLPGDPFFTVVMSGSTQLFIVPETDIGCSVDFGLSADFDTTVLRSQLGGRRVFARITLFDPRGTRIFDSPTLSSPY